MTTTNTYYKDNYTELKEDIIYEMCENNPIDYDDLISVDCPFDYFLEEQNVALTKEEIMEILDEIETIYYHKWLEEQDRIA